MENNSLVMEAIQAFREQTRTTDSTNRKILTALIVAIISFSLTIISITYLYFNTDYDYGEISQSQNQSTNTDGSDN